MLALDLPEEIEQRLDKLAIANGKTKNFYVQDIILQHLEDIEDTYIAEKEYKEYIESGEEAISLEEMEKRLGLAN